MTRRVAVTGMGVVSAFGVGEQQLWAALVHGRNGIRSLTRCPETAGVHIAAQVPDYDVSPYVRQPKAIKTMTLPAKFLMTATHLALSQAGLLAPDSRIDRRSAIRIGTGSRLVDDHAHTAFHERPALWYLLAQPNLALSHLANNFEFRGDYDTNINACAAGTKAIADAAAQIAHGDADLAIAGGTESKITPEHIAGYSRLGALTKSADSEHACRPFDRKRNGFVMGEGAGVLVLEDYERARIRGAHIRAFVSGWGAALDGFRLTDPHPEGAGLAQSMEQALARAGVKRESIGYINAHGTSTLANDRAESIAIRRVFGSAADNIAISATKSMTGHAAAASGAIEAVTSVLSLEQQTVHPTRNFHEGCEVCNLDYVRDAARKLSFRYAMSNSSGFGGVNASLIFEAAS